MTYLVENAFSGSLLILITTLLRKLFYKFLPVETWLILWLVCMVRLLSPATPESPISFYNIFNISNELYYYEYSGSNEFNAGISNNYLTKKAFPDEEAHASILSVPLSNTFDMVSRIIYPLYILGASLFMSVFIVNWMRIYRFVRNADPVNDCDKLYEYIPDSIMIKEGRFTDVPFTFGVVSPTIILPPRISSKFLRFVLLHESIHAKRRDNLWHYLMALTTVVYWWNPIVWFMAFYLRRDIELSCDYAVLRICENDCRKEYAESLISMSTIGRMPMFSNSFNRNNAKERIYAIMKFKKRGIFAFVMAIALICSVSLTFAAGAIDLNEREEPETVLNKNANDVAYDVVSYSTSDNHLEPELVEDAVNTFTENTEMTRYNYRILDNVPISTAGTGWTQPSDCGAYRISVQNTENVRLKVTVSYGTSNSYSFYVAAHGSSTKTINNAWSGYYHTVDFTSDTGDVGGQISVRVSTVDL